MASRSKRGSSRGSSARGRAGKIRIIAGQWRGRQLIVEDVDGLRPTGDRIKEMLFNWLQASIAGSRCLDLFAGSGGLGFEAASRYAEQVVLVERDRTAAAQLASQIEQFDAANLMTLRSTSAEQFLNENSSRFDLIFVDPPFLEGLLDTILPLLPAHLADGGLVYVECGAKQTVFMPAGFSLLKEKITGDVSARLFQFSSKNAD